MRRAALLLLLGAGGLCSCHHRIEDPAAVIAEEQDQLNDAAASLDANGGTQNDSDTNSEDPG